MRRSSYFIQQSPSEDEQFPYWTPDDYLVRKFELGNAGIRQLLAARTSLPNYTRKSTVRLHGYTSLQAYHLT
jgi:hypothetical protein